MNTGRALDEAFRSHHHGQLGRAKELCQEILKRDPTDIKALILLGVIAYEDKDFLSAIELNDKAITLNPNIPEAHSNRGLALEQLKRFDEAMYSYDKAIAINPNFAKVLYNRGNALKELNRLDEAIDSYDKAIAINPSYAKAYANRGTALQDLNRLDDAVGSFEKSIALDSANLKFKALASIVYQELGKISEASEHLKSVISFTSRNIEDIRLKSAAHIRLGQWQVAFDSCPAPQSPPAHLHDSFDSLALANYYLKALPNLQFMASRDYVPRPTVMFAGDELYIDRFFDQALTTVKQKNPEYNVHLHAMLSSSRDESFLKKFISSATSISYEPYSPTDKTGYTTRRFVRMSQLIRYLKKPILCLDIDSKIVGNLGQLFSELASYDVGVYRRNRELYINQLRHAAIFYASATPGALRFLGFFINYISHLEKHQQLNWFADQMALLAADLWATRRSGIIKVGQIQNEILSWTIQEKSTLIMTLKGKQKER